MSPGAGFASGLVGGALVIIRPGRSTACLSGDKPPLGRVPVISGVQWDAPGFSPTETQQNQGSARGPTRTHRSRFNEDDEGE